MMPHDNASAPLPLPAKKLRFERYVLDFDRGCLLVDGQDIALRPKTFLVLGYLVQNCGRLVSKDDLFAAVWPSLTVTDDALVQSVSELRRAFGDDGPRLLKTIPRRGYRFEANVSVDEPDAPPIHNSTLTHGSHRLRGPASARRHAVMIAAGALGCVLLAAGFWIGLTSEPKLAGSSGAAAQADIATPITAAPTARPAIAVLPFVNQSRDSARDYFTDGLTQDIINALGRFPELTVMSWNAVAPYKGKPESPGQVARNLAVDYQVEGSVVHDGERVGVIAQLVSIDGRVLWSFRTEDAVANLFALQSRITSEIAGALAIRLSRIEQRRVLSKPTASLEAYEYVLRARLALQRPARANIVEARAWLRRAIEIDPNYAAAFAALAETYYSAVSMGWAETPEDTLRRAEDMANKALSLNDSEVRARVVLGRIRIFHQQPEQAIAELNRAVGINPNDANALAGRGNILMWLGQGEAAIEALELAQRIDPELNPLDSFALSLAYYAQRRYDAAIAQAQINLRRTASANFNHIVLAAAFAQQSRPDDVGRVATAIRRDDPTFDPMTFGNKFLNPSNLEHLRDGLRKAGLYVDGSGLPSAN